MDQVQFTKEFLEAYNLGKQFAYRIRVGKRFFGSMPIARKLYKDIDSHQSNGFMCGFAQVLDFKTVCVNPHTGLVSGFVDSTGKFSLK